MQGSGPSSIATARNYAARDFLENAELEWLLFVDSDMTPKPDTAVRLLAIAEATGAGIVSALYFERREGFWPSLLYQGGWVLPAGLAKLHGVVSVDAVGLGCTLIQRRVLEALGDPFFQHPAEEPGEDEDFHFCLRAKKAGFSIVVDTDFDCGHLAVMPLTRQLIESWYQTPEYRRRLTGDEKSATWRDTTRVPVRFSVEPAQLRDHHD
jgi:hypothetical protein